MRIALVGQKFFGAAVFEALRADGHEVLAAVAPGPGDRLWDAAVAAGVLSAPALTLALVAVDLIVAAHAHAFITSEARSRVPHGAIGYHPSLLPLHRGRDAVRWAVHCRDRVTGGTVYQMTDAVDGGPIIEQEHVFVRPDDDATSLWRRELAPLGVRLLARAVRRIAESGSVAPLCRPQDEALATWEPSWERAPLARSNG